MNSSQRTSNGILLCYFPSIYIALLTSLTYLPVTQWIGSQMRNNKIQLEGEFTVMLPYLNITHSFCLGPGCIEHTHWYIILGIYPLSLDILFIFPYIHQCYKSFAFFTNEIYLRDYYVYFGFAKRFSTFVKWLRKTLLRFLYANILVLITHVYFLIFF